MADGEGKALIKAGGGVHAIVPQSFDEAWRVAQALAASGMTPKEIATPEKVLAVIMAGAEIGMAPFQALQSFAVINGRPALWGDGMLAVARKFGVKVEESLSGDTASCTVTRPDTGESVTRTFSMADAKQAGLAGKQGPWTTYPKRMLQMRARAWALRDGCADMLRGMKMAEEVQDYEVISNEPIVEKVLNEETGRMVNPNSAHQLKKNGVWDAFADTLQGYRDALDLDGLKAWYANDETASMIAKWPSTWRDSADEEFGVAHDAIEAALKAGA